MGKRSINILLAVLIINTVTFFQSGNVLSNTPKNSSASAHSFHNPPTNWVSYILHELNGSEHHSSDVPHPIKFKRRYVTSRSVNFSLFLAKPILFLFYTPAKYIPENLSKNYFRSIIPRPAYYNFLFRLSPF
jgi:hypothetical protein